MRKFEIIEISSKEIKETAAYLISLLLFFNHIFINRLYSQECHGESEEKTKKKIC